VAVTSMNSREPYFLLLILFLLPGCSYQCHFEARGGVRDAGTGQPIQNARVRLLDANGRRLAHPASTNLQGEFQVAFTTVPSLDVELTGWNMVLSADGFEPETIAVGPVKEPKRGDVTVYLVFQVAMRKSQAKQ